MNNGHQVKMKKIAIAILAGSCYIFISVYGQASVQSPKSDHCHAKPSLKSIQNEGVRFKTQELSPKSQINLKAQIFV